MNVTKIKNVKHTGSDQVMDLNSYCLLFLKLYASIVYVRLRLPTQGLEQNQGRFFKIASLLKDEVKKWPCFNGFVKLLQVLLQACFATFLETNFRANSFSITHLMRHMTFIDFLITHFIYLYQNLLKIWREIITLLKRPRVSLLTFLVLLGQSFRI